MRVLARALVCAATLEGGCGLRAVGSCTTYTTCPIPPIPPSCPSRVCARACSYQAGLRLDFQQLLTEFTVIQHRAQAKLSRGWERVGGELAAAVAAETGTAYVPAAASSPAPASAPEMATSSPAVAAALHFGAGPLSAEAPPAVDPAVASMFASALSSEPLAAAAAAAPPTPADADAAEEHSAFADVGYAQ